MTDHRLTRAIENLRRDVMHRRWQKGREQERERERLAPPDSPLGIAREARQLAIWLPPRQKDMLIEIAGPGLRGPARKGVPESNLRGTAIPAVRALLQRGLVERRDGLVVATALGCAAARLISSRRRSAAALPA